MRVSAQSLFVYFMGSRRVICDMGGNGKDDVEKGVRYRAAQHRLGLAKWQIELAVECGLLRT